MIKRFINSFVIASMFFGISCITSCSVKNENLLSNINQKNIITIYSVCPQKNGQRIKDHYLFKIKDDRITLTEKHGDSIQNKLTTDLKIADELKELISNSSQMIEKDNACEYYVKCGIQESNLYLSNEKLDQLETLIQSFSSPV